MNGEQREYWMGRRGLHWINMKQIDGECCVFVNATNILSLMFLAFETLFFPVLLLLLTYSGGLQLNILIVRLIKEIVLPSLIEDCFIF